MSSPPNPEHIRQLLKGVDSWNSWRRLHPDEVPRLRGVDLKLRMLKGVELAGADLYTANLWKTNLDGANLQGADLSSTTMNGVSLIGAKLQGANLRFARLVGADVEGANFSGCKVYGCSIWNLRGKPGEQLDVIVTPPNEPKVTVDDLQIAQFVHLMVANSGLRDTLELMSSKAVLLLGGFATERKEILDAIRDELRLRNFIPLMFDFEPLPNQTLTQTVSILAHMSRFVIADVTEPRSVPHELGLLVPSLPMVPFQPIVEANKKTWAMFPDLMMHPSVLGLFRYDNLTHLKASLDACVIGPAQAKAEEQSALWLKIRRSYV